MKGILGALWQLEETKMLLDGALAHRRPRLTGVSSVHRAMLCAAIVCPVVNTGVFIACMLSFFRDVLAAWAGGGDIIAYILSGLVLLNFVPELIINIVFSPAGQRILHTVRK